MSEIAVLTKDGKKGSSVKLPEGVFGHRVNTRVLHQAIVMYQASLRQGTASTKERVDVSGGGKKPYRQKGTGRARAGSSRSPLWRGGGVTFGPHPRDFGYSISKKTRRVALRESLNAKIKDKQIFCIEDLKDKFEKTKEFAKIMKGLKLEGKTLGLLDGSDESIQRVSRNIAHFNIMSAKDVNAFDIMRNKNILVSKTALDSLLKRLKDVSEVKKTRATKTTAKKETKS